METRSLNPLSDIPPEITLSYLIDNALTHQLETEGSEHTGESASAAQKRGRGRPPKQKPESQQNGQFPTNLNEAPVPAVSEDAQPGKRQRGRPRKDRAPVMAEAGPRRGRGRPRKSNPVPSVERVSPVVVADSPRNSGQGEAGGAVVVPAPVVIGDVTAAKRRGRPPKTKIGGVISVSPTGRPRGRPRKDGVSPAVAAAAAAAAEAEAPTRGAADHEMLKRNFDFLREKVMEVTKKLKEAVEELQAMAAGGMSNRF